MYCSVCGQPLDPGQTICQKCGRQIAPIASYAPVSYPRNRVHRHMHVMAILWIVYSLWILLHWVIAVGFLAGAYTNWAHTSHGFDGFYAFPFFQATWLVPLIAAVLVGRAILCLVTGISLLRHASWARILAIVTAFLALIHPIIGTVLGIYTLWVLLPSASGQEYEQIVVA
jgi:predicted nucleic acid-binding Zn ribbon protein